MQDLHMVSEAGFSQVDERAASLTLQRARQTQQGHHGMQSIAELLCSQSSMQQSHTDGNLWEAAAKPFVPLPLAALQPKIKVGPRCIEQVYHICQPAVQPKCRSKGWLVQLCLYWMLHLCCMSQPGLLTSCTLLGLFQIERHSILADTVMSYASYI